MRSFKTINEIKLPKLKDTVIIIESEGRRNERKVKGLVVNIYDRYIQVKKTGKNNGIARFLKADILTGNLECKII